MSTAPGWSWDLGALNAEAARLRAEVAELKAALALRTTK